MNKFQKSDDGNVVDGAIVVWMGSSGPDEEEPAPAAVSAATKNTAAKEQAAALASAAESGVPFCQRCDPPAAARTK
ncbi:MAG TPA: hypothetical protein VH083_07845 [Myxococcales bacterium]|jgi:hypothetical protein|nr:hypothetical protein [Myxococcales bacterium]